jgi:hypothetical protein
VNKTVSAHPFVYPVVVLNPRLNQQSVAASAIPMENAAYAKKIIIWSMESVSLVSKVKPVHLDQPQVQHALVYPAQFVTISSSWMIGKFGTPAGQI